MCVCERESGGVACMFPVQFLSMDGLIKEDSARPGSSAGAVTLCEQLRLPKPARRRVAEINPTLI